MADNSKIEWCDSTWNPIRARAKEDMVIRGREVPAGKWGYHCERISPGCVNCLRPDSLVLYSDLQWRPIGEVRIGDELLSFDEHSAKRKPNGVWGPRKWQKAIVENVWWLKNWAYSIRADQHSATASADHRWLSLWNRWIHTSELSGASRIRSMPITPALSPTESYRIGYLAGMTIGDGTFRYIPGQRSDKLGFPQAYWRVALSDEEPLGRLVAYLAGFGVEAHVRPFSATAASDRLPMQKVEVRALGNLQIIHNLIRGSISEDSEYARGWLAGFFDAEGSNSDSLRLSQVPLEPLRFAQRMASKLGFVMDLEDKRHYEGIASTVRLKGEMTDRIRFLGVIQPAIKRKILSGIVDVCVQTGSSGVETVEKTHAPIDLVDIQTSTRTFIADGLLTHNCYASTMNGRMLPAWGTGLDFAVPNREKVEIFLDEEELLKPLKWKRPRRIFVESMSDWCATFVTDEMRDRILAVAALCPQHTFLFLTKRADRCVEYFDSNPRYRIFKAIEGHADLICAAMERLGWKVQKEHLGHMGDQPVHEYDVTGDFAWPLSNVQLGFSAENQEYFDERWSRMRRLAAAGWNVWCSAEPLLGPIDMRSGVSEVQCANHCDWMGPEAELESDEDGHEPHCPKCGSNWAIIDRPEILIQVVVGGESGHGARPMCPDWARSIRDQCVKAGVAFFFKQWGQYGWWDQLPEETYQRIDAAGTAPTDAPLPVGKKAAGRLLDGREWNEMPEAR